MIKQVYYKGIVRLGGKGQQGIGVELFRLDNEDVELEEQEIEAIQEDPEEMVEPEPIDRTGTALVRIYESIGVDWFDGTGISAKRFASDMDSLGDIRRLNIHINSLGGDLHTAQAMYSIISDFECFKKTSYIDGVAASAATIVACGADEVIARKNTNYMVHRPWACCIGNAAQMQKAAEDLDKLTIPIVSVYHDQVNGRISDEKIRDLMDRETWLTAEEALTYGFVDRIRGKINPLARANKSTLMAGNKTMNYAKYHYMNFPNFPFSNDDNDKPKSEDLERKSKETMPLDKSKELPPTQKTGGKLTVDEIRERDPDLLSTIQLDARQMERTRLAELERFSAPGIEGLVMAAKADGRTVSDIAVEAATILGKVANQNIRLGQMKSEGASMGRVGAGDAPIVRPDKSQQGTSQLIAAFNRRQARPQLNKRN